MQEESPIFPSEDDRMANVAILWEDCFNEAVCARPAHLAEEMGCEAVNEAIWNLMSDGLPFVKHVLGRRVFWQKDDTEQGHGTRMVRSQQPIINHAFPEVVHTLMGP